MLRLDVDTWSMAKRLRKSTYISTPPLPMYPYDFLQISPASTAPVSPAVTPEKRGRRVTQIARNALPKSGMYLGFGNFASAPARAQGRAAKLAEEGGDDLEPSPAPSLRGVRHQFSLDINVGTPTRCGEFISTIRLLYVTYA